MQIKLKSHNWKLIFGVVGIILTLVGHIVKEHEQYPLLNKILANKYLNAINAIDGMRKNDIILLSEDVGFKEVVGIVKEEIYLVDNESNQRINESDPRYVEPIIKQLKITSWGSALPMEGPYEGEWCELDSFEITILDGSLLIVDCYNLKERVEQRYLQSWVKNVGECIFWLGILLSIASLFLKKTTK